jgi:hypothetical protein
MTIQRVIARLKTLNLSLNLWYLDDGTLIGSLGDLELALGQLDAEFRSMGLTLNLEKCSLFGDTSSPPSTPFLAQIPHIPGSEGVVVLGVPVGSDDFILRHTIEIEETMKNMLSRLSQLQPSFARFLLLRECLGPCRVNHLLRTLDYSHGLRLARNTAAMVRTSFEEILGITCSDLQLQLACFQVRHGGLGLRNPMLVHIPAMLSSIFSFAQQTGSLPQLFHHTMQPALQAIRPLCDVPNELLTLPSNIDVSSDLLDDSWGRQRFWQSMVDAAAHRFWNASQPSLRLQCLQKLNAARYSADISELVIPETGKPPLSSHGWQLMARLRLGLPLSSEAGLPCPGCSRPLDSYGDHALCCSDLGVYSRHTHLRNELAEVCVELGLQVEIEKNIPGSHTRPADVLVHGLVDGLPTALDCSVTHPLQLSSPLAGVLPGKQAKVVERRKLRDSFWASKRAGWDFHPFVLETVGAWGGHARHVLQHIIRRWSLVKGCSKAEAARVVKLRISAALLVGTSRQLERAYPEDGPFEPACPPRCLF